MSFLFGDSGSPAESFRGPGYMDQGNILNAYTMGQFINPDMLSAQQARVSELEKQNAAAIRQRQQQMETMRQNGLLRYDGINQNPLIQMINTNTPELQALEEAKKRLGIMENAQPFMNQNQFQAGQQIEGQIGPTTSAAFLKSLGQKIPTNFTKRKAFNFTDPTQGMTAQQMVGDAFTPQYDMAQRLASREGAEQRNQIAEDMNRRGMLASGMTTRAMQLQQRDQGDRLANLSSQLAANQAQQMLGANQYLQGMNWNKQQTQAEEVFRQQGATDSQAQFLANMALQQRQQQMSGQQQRYAQQLGGRQQALGEYQLQNQSSRQPYEDLFRLYQLSTGGTGGTAPTQGLLGNAAGGIGAGVGMGLGALMLCLPKGTPIKTKDGHINVEDVKIGDEVVGGKVIATVQKKRDADHRFYLHKFEGKEVVMSKGHPYFEELKSMEIVAHDSPYTYDIMTDSGYYYVNEIRLGSTLDPNFILAKSFFMEVSHGL